MNKEQFGVFEIKPSHGKEKHGLILGPYNTKEEAKEKGERYGYSGSNYYVGLIKKNKSPMERLMEISQPRPEGMWERHEERMKLRKQPWYRDSFSKAFKLIHHIRENNIDKELLAKDMGLTMEELDNYIQGRVEYKEEIINKFKEILNVDLNDKLSL